MKSFLKKNYVFIVTAVTVILVIALVVLAVPKSEPSLNTGASVAASNINPAYRDTSSVEPSEAAPTAAAATEPAEATAKAETEPSASAKAPTAASTAAESTAVPSTPAQIIPFATAIPPQTKADYTEQWNQGYLVAIDNPDKTYACGHVTLTEEDRDLLERLCMGEFGSGGFIGAALIAQAVKDAMCFDGFPTVESVIKGCHYDGSTEMGTNTACRQAVRYIFDDDGEAVQHRIMYMYNPYMVNSAFHESQNYILSYMNVRFFDRWNY